MSTKQRIPSDDLSFEPDELAEVGAVLAPSSPQVEEPAATSDQTPPQPMLSFDDQVDAAFSEEETAEKRPSVRDEPDAENHLDALVDASLELETAPADSATAPEIGTEEEQTSFPSGEFDDPTPPAVSVSGDELPSAMFEETPFSDEARTEHDDGPSITPHVAAVAAAMDEQTADFAVLSSSPAPNKQALAVAVQSESVGLAKSLPASHISRPEAPAKTAAYDEHADSEDPFAEPVSPSSATPVVHLDEAEFHLVEDSDDPQGLASGKTPVATADEPAPHVDLISSAPPVTGSQDWLAPSSETPPAPVQHEHADDDATWQSPDSGPITTVSLEDIEPATGDVPTVAEAPPPQVASQVSPAHDARRPSGASVPAIPPPLPPATKIAPPPPPAAARPPTPPPVPAAKAVVIDPPTPVSRPLIAPPPASLPNFGEESKLKKKKRSKQWFEEIFDEDYLHTLPFLTPQQTEREVDFLQSALDLPAGSRLLDIGCGYGRHAMELAARGYQTVGLDLSLPLLLRANEAARRVGVSVDFVHGDMREMVYDSEFDGAFCFFTSYGFFDDEMNRKVASLMCRALRPGGRLVLDLINRDSLIGELPTRVWWQGHGCMVMEVVDFNYFTSRLEVQRQVVIEDGRQLVQDISIRLYSLHEIGKILTHAGFRVLEVSGSFELRNRFYGTESRHLLIVAEKQLPGTA